MSKLCFPGLQQPVPEEQSLIKQNHSSGVGKPASFLGVSILTCLYSVGRAREHTGGCSLGVPCLATWGRSCTIPAIWLQRTLTLWKVPAFTAFLSLSIFRFPGPWPQAFPHLFFRNLFLCDCYTKQDLHVPRIQDKASEGPGKARRCSWAGDGAPPEGSQENSSSCSSVGEPSSGASLGPGMAVLG